MTTTQDVSHPSGAGGIPVATGTADAGDRGVLRFVRDLTLLICGVAALAALLAGAYLAQWTGTGVPGMEPRPVEVARSSGPGQSPGAVSSAAARPAGRGVPASAVPESEVIHADLFFDLNRARLRADAVSVLQDKARILTGGGTWVVLAHGYTDPHGPTEYNRALAQRRAEAVKQFLVELGVPDGSIKVVTVGKEGALCEDGGRECRQLNRRVHLEMRKLDGPAGAAPEPERSTPASEPR